MSKKILIFYLFIGISPAKAVFTNFSEPLKKSESSQIVQKIGLENTKKTKGHKIQSAIIWRLPPREFLGKKLSPEEEILIDTEALNRFIEAASKNNPDAYKNFNKQNKNQQIVTQLIIKRFDLTLLENHLTSKNYQQELDKKFVLKEVKTITKLYESLKAIYSQNNHASFENYEDIKTKISLCCGLENFLYVEGLLKREIHYEIFNT